MVVAVVAMLTVVVTEVVHTAGVRIQLAANQRDEAKAEALAAGGVQFYRLVLIASRQLEGSPMMKLLNDLLMGSGLAPINSDALWQLIPSVSTGVLRLVLAAGGDGDDAEKLAASGDLTQEQIDETRERGRLKKAFLDFDGDFASSVRDEDGRVFVGRLPGTDLPTLMQDHSARLLLGLMSSRAESDYLRERDLEAWELIGNLADWTDLDDNRVWRGGRETQLYERGPGDLTYLPKNGPFDTVEEIRLVEGWHTDEAWRRYGQHLTIYGSGRVNINTAPRKVLAALIRSHCQGQIGDDALEYLLDVIQTYLTTSPLLGGGSFTQPSTFVQFLTQNAPCPIDPAIETAIKTRSTVFRVTSKGQVGKATAEIEAVFDFERNNRLGRVMYWRIK